MIFFTIYVSLKSLKQIELKFDKTGVLVRSSHVDGEGYRYNNRMI